MYETPISAQAALTVRTTRCRTFLVLALAALFLSVPARAFKVMLSPGAASNTTEATVKSLWPYSAANVDGGKFGGTWGNGVYTPSSDRQKIADNYTNRTAQIEDVVYNFDKLDGNGDPIPPAWLVNHTLPGNYTTTANLGQNVLFANFYNANGRSWNTASELADIQQAFTQSGINNVNFGTIIRNAGGGYQTFLQPYGHFLFEIRTDTVLQNSGLQTALIDTTKWGLDNGKDVFLQILPQRTSRDFEFDMRAVMEILYNRLGAARFQNPKLWIVLASYDGSEYNTRFAPETFNGGNHFNTLTGVAKTMLENRTAWQAGNFIQTRSTYTVEAESASGQSAFPPYATVSESGVTYISWPGSSLSNSGYPGTSDGRALYTFHVSAAGTVALEANVNFADSNSDSFWYKIDDLPWQMEIDESGGGLIWVGLGRYALKAGDHTLEVVRRRTNAKIDKFRFASSTATITAIVLKSATASAGPDQVVYDYDANATESVTLDASGSSVASGTITSYIWKKGATQIATGVQPSVKLAAGTHDITLTVTGSTGGTDTASTQVIVRANDNKVVVENSTEDILDTSAYGETHYITNFRVAKADGRKLVVTVGSKSIGSLAITYAGKSLTLAKRQDDGTSHASIWYLDNPPAGVADIVQTGGAARGSSLGVLSLQNAAPGVSFTAGVSARSITYTVPLANTVIVGSYSDSYENAGPSAPQTNKFVTSGGWGGSALAGWQSITSAGSRTDTYRVSTTKPVAISTVGFIAASPKSIEAETAVGQSNLPPFVQQTDADGTSYIIVPNGTGDANPSNVTNLTGLASYNFSLTAAATVDMDARVLFATSSDDSFWYRMDGGAWTKKQGPVSAVWQWLRVASFPTLAAGSHTFEIVRSEDGAKFDKLRLTPSAGNLSFVAPPPVYLTYGNGGIPGTGDPWQIDDTLPTRIEAENYDQGAEGATYHDTTIGNTGAVYRTDGVDIQATADTGGGYNIGYVATGEWLQYTVNVARSTYYTLNLRVSRQTAGTGLVRVLFNGVDKTGSLVVPNTTNWNNYVNLPITVKLDAGQQVMRVEMLSPSFNLNYIEFTPQNLPSPWQHQDIGTVAATGDAIYNSGIFTVFGSGSDIFGQSDKFHYAWQPANGDCELIARLTGMDNTSAGAKAGVMIRESLDANARQFSIFVTPGQGIVYEQRVATGGFTSSTTAAGLSTPCWLKIKRAGNLFSGTYSLDGVTWTGLGSQGFLIDKNATIGLAVTSKNDGSLCAATFDNVTITANTAPEISDIEDRSVAVNAAAGVISFEIDDLQTAAASLTVTATSSNPALVPNVSLIPGGSGAIRTLAVAPAPDQLGSATITVTVSDGSKSATGTFDFTVAGTGLETWRFAHFGTTANTVTGADDFDGNGDGENNLLEFATAQNPKATGIAAISFVKNSGNLEFTYTRSLAAMADGVTFAVEETDSLADGSWTAAEVVESVISVGGTMQTVKAALASDEGGKRFVRLTVVRP